MANIVVYESKYGSTEKYAKWIGAELNCKVKRISEVSIEELESYENIIFGGWVHAGKLEGFKTFLNSVDKFKDKSLFVFTCGIAVTEDKSYLDYKEKNFKEFNNLKDFYFRGAFDFNKLDFMDKVMMSIFKVLLKMKKSESTVEISKAYDKPIDFTNRENIKGIVREVKSLGV